MSTVRKYRIYRYHEGCQASMQSYFLSDDSFTGKMLLDALEAIKSQQDPSLSFRRSCGSGVCGSDGMNINGRNGLACMTSLDELPELITLYPMPGMPVIRDLIVDLTGFFNQLKRVKPWLQPSKQLVSNTDKEFIQNKEEREKLDGLYECILCACCTSACPSYWWNPTKFIGPAGLLAACRFILDSRDGKKTERLQSFEDLYKLYRCRGIMNCVEVCPKGLNPNHAIGVIRREMLGLHHQGTMTEQGSEDRHT